ncbi:putative Rho guanyl-nucleotide exchange factor, partial [Trypoxylus dichotomus]
MKYSIKYSFNKTFPSSIQQRVDATPVVIGVIIRAAAGARPFSLSRTPPRVAIYRPAVPQPARGFTPDPQELSHRLGDDKTLAEHLKLPIQRINDYQLLIKLPQVDVKDHISDENTFELIEKTTNQILILTAHRQNVKQFWLREIREFAGEVDESISDDLQVTSEPTSPPPESVQLEKELSESIPEAPKQEPKVEEPLAKVPKIEEPPSKEAEKVEEPPLQEIPKVEKLPPKEVAKVPEPLPKEASKAEAPTQPKVEEAPQKVIPKVEEVPKKVSPKVEEA